MSFEPTDHFGSAFVRREHRIKHMFHPSTAKDQSQALHQSHSADFKCRQAHGLAEFKLCIAQNLKWQMQPLRHLALVFTRLSAQAEYGGVQGCYFAMMIAEAAGLRC